MKEFRIKDTTIEKECEVKKLIFSEAAKLIQSRSKTGMRFKLGNENFRTEAEGLIILYFLLKL